MTHILDLRGKSEDDFNVSFMLLDVHGIQCLAVRRRESRRRQYGGAKQPSHCFA